MTALSTSLAKYVLFGPLERQVYIAVTICMSQQYWKKDEKK